jgi:excisionase family DNA binding protein
MTRKGNTMVAHTDSPAGGPAQTSGQRLYRISEAAQLLSLGRTVIYEQIRAGRLRSVQQGRARLISSAAIADYIALLEEEEAARCGGRRWPGHAQVS